MSDKVDTEIHRYEGFRGTVRLLSEVTLEGVALLRDEIQRCWKIALGKQDSTGHTCDLKDCQRDTVGEYPAQERWKEDLNVCRRHWLLLHGTINLIKIVVWGALLSAPLVLLVVMQ